MANEKRLIDANALENLIRTNAKVEANDTKYDIGRVHGLINAADLIRNAPAVDAVEVVHGRWIAVPSSDMMTGKAYKCSECNKMRYGSFMPNYCQNCGAKMDGGTP